jgi:hypothetical protein
VRERWNPVIHQCLKGIDYHNELYFKTKDVWHLEKAQHLRSYVIELKAKIAEEETGLSTISHDLTTMQPITAPLQCFLHDAL